MGDPLAIPIRRIGWNREGVGLPAIASRSGEAGGHPTSVTPRNGQAGSLGTEEKTLCSFSRVISVQN